MRSMKNKIVSLGVDIGGTGCKCAAFEEDGTQLAVVYREYPLKPGTVNLPPDLLTSSVFEVISRCAAEVPDRSSIAAVTVSSFGESFAALDEEGSPLAEIQMYFGDSDSCEFTGLVRKIGAEKFMETAMLYPDASYSLSRMLSTESTAKKPVQKYLFVAGYLCYQLCGRACTDVSLACRSLLYDVRNNCWARGLAEACGIRPETLPEVLPTGSEAGTVLPEIAARLGLPSDTKVVIGAHDQIVNALGAGATGAGEAVDTSGTCECLTPLFSELPSDPGFVKNRFACVPYPDSLGYVTYAYNISAGSVVRWFRDTFGKALQKEASERGLSIYDLLNEKCPPEPTGLMVLPFLQGMGGTPEADSQATGLIAGLTTRTELPDIYRAILEGITFEMRYNQECLNKNGISWNRLYACGGGARSKIWLQIKADILNCRIVPVMREETGAMGSAILGLSAVSGESIRKISRRFAKYGPAVCPNPEHQKIYNEKYQIYKALRKLYTGRNSLFSKAGQEGNSNG